VAHCGIDDAGPVVAGLNDMEKMELIFSLNYARRSLSKLDRQAVIAECKNRGMSLRSIAEVVGISHENVRRLGVTNVTPDSDSAEPEPEPVVTVAERAMELRAQGLIEAAIGASANDGRAPTARHW
jgi:transposase-like protein